MWMTSPVAGAVRIMPAVGHGVPGTSTGVIETDSAFTQHCVRESQVRLSVSLVLGTFQPIYPASPEAIHSLNVINLLFPITGRFEQRNTNLPGVALSRASRLVGNVSL